MRSLLIPLLACLFFFHSCTENSLIPESPDGKIKVPLGLDADQAFTYRVLRDGKEMVKPSSFRLCFEQQGDFSGGLQMKLISSDSHDTTWQPLWGKTSSARDQYNEYVVRLSERKGQLRFLHWVIRVYNDGVAFRYSFPEGSGFGAFRLTDELCQFSLDASDRAWAVNHGDYYTSQEHLFEERPVGEIRREELIGCPLLVEVKDAGWLLLTEADLTDWAGLYFRADGQEPGEMLSSLAPLKRNPAIKVEADSPVSSPWRVIMVGADPGDLIESNLIANLNDPSEYVDVDWIRPGLSAWDRWWSGDYGPDAGFELGMNTATMKYFVDLAHEMGWR